MRAFVLGTGRCGTTTIVRACGHFTNYAAGHETRWGEVGAARFAYPDHHIEADNRLSWFLGQLGQAHPDAVFVHLFRDPEAVARSYLRRWEFTDSLPQRLRRLRYRGHDLSIVPAFAHAIDVAPAKTREQRLELCRFYVVTVRANIEAFLRDRPHIRMDIDEPDEGFQRLVDTLGAEGDLDAARAELRVHHNDQLPRAPSGRRSPGH